VCCEYALRACGAPHSTEAGPTDTDTALGSHRAWPLLGYVPSDDLEYVVGADKRRGVLVQPEPDGEGVQAQGCHQSAQVGSLGEVMFLIVGFGGDAVQRVPGIFQVIALGLLLIPAMTISSLVWRGVGEGMRDRVRLLVRFWPLTLIALIYLLGGLRLLLE